MRNRPGQINLEQSKRKITVVCNVVFLLGPGFFVCGCNRPSVPAITDYGPDVSDPRQVRAFEILRDGLVDAEALIRIHAIEAVVATRRQRLMPMVQRLLTDKSMPVRFAAAVAVGDLKYSIARNSVSLALKDPDHNVIIAASYAMGRLGDTEYYEVVRKALSSSDQTVRANAAFLLGRIGDPRVIELLKQVQQDRTSVDKVRFQALESRAELGDPTVLKKLWAMVYGYSEDRMIGVRAMGALGGSKAREILVTKLDDEMLEVRLAAAEQLGKLGDRSGQQEVRDVFEKNLTAGLDERALERINVLTAMAIGRICTPALTKYLPELMKDKSKSVCIAAAKAVLLCRAR